MSDEHDTGEDGQAEERRCTQCGAVIPEDAPGGGCPGCMVEAALDPEPPEGVPSRESLSELFPEMEIRALLGRGGMGAVFKARQTQLDRVVALKLLPAQPGARGDAFADRFAREARALARLDHPNIVRVFEFGERGGIHFLVMEYVDGVNLREAMLDGDITPRQALAIVPQICDALQYAHDHGVVHRDIKPENVLISKDGAVKVADFGLAKMMVGVTEDVTLTRAGQVMGTVHYMAPEQVESPASVDHRADIYSLGVVFYEMLTGELPVGRFEPPSRRARVDARLDEVVLRALERKRERRYQRASDVKTAVSGIEDPGSGAPVPPTTAAATAAQVPLSTPGLLSLLALPCALVLVLVAGGVAKAFGGDSNAAYVAVASVAGILGFLAFLLGIAGVVETRGGRRRGMWMGVVGLTAALVWTPVITIGSYYGLEVPELHYQRRVDRLARVMEGMHETGPDGEPVPMGIDATDPPFKDPEFKVTTDSGVVRTSLGTALKARLQYLLGAAARAAEAKGEEAMALRRALTGLARLDGQPNSGAGTYGLTDLDQDALPVSLERFRVVRAHVRSAHRASDGLATARYERTEITFGFRYDNARSDWFLSTEPIGVSQVPSREPDIIWVYNANGTGILNGETSVAVLHMETTFKRWRETPYDEKTALSFVQEADHPLVERGAMALPLDPSIRDDPRRRRLHVSEVHYTDDRQVAALVTAESDEGKAIFVMKGSGDGWLFATGTVSVEWFEDRGR